MMNVYKMIAAAGLLSTAALAHGAIAYEPPEFVESEWRYIGTGYYEPGIFDYFTNEYPLDVDCKFYRNLEDENVIWVEPEDMDINSEEFMPAAEAFIVHTENPDKVWTTPIWTLHPLLFCAYHIVPEIMGMQGSSAYYGKLEGRKISFPANSHSFQTFPNGTPATNVNGNFALMLPDEAGVGSLSATDTAKAEYFDLQGCRVDNPVSGCLYIVKRGAKTSKVIF